MDGQKKFAIVGSGNGGMAFAAQIAAKGYPVVMFKPRKMTEDFIKLNKTREMFLEGDITCGGKIIGVTNDMAEAASETDVFFVVLPSFAHELVFTKLIPFLRDGQHVIIVPGNFGGFLLRKMMVDAGCKADVAISETSSLPYACRTARFDTVMVYKKKFRLKLGTCPARMGQAALKIINDCFDGYIEFYPAESILEMDFDNVNYTLHPMPVLLNYGEIEKNPKTFRHYMDGITPLVSEKMMQMDAERMDTGKKLGLDLMPIMDQLKMYYGHNSTETIYEYANSPESPYKDIVGHSVRSRYLTEDVPYSMVPCKLIGEKAGQPMPVVDLVIRLASFLHDRDYAVQGHTLEKLGLDDMTLEELKEYARTGEIS
jgi:opine dehydrogenase